MYDVICTIFLKGILSWSLKDRSSFFSHLKTEKVYLEKPQTLEVAEAMMNEYIRFYKN
ncbi:IS3 family transposase [Paenibacillus larvae]|uniref:Transposase n=2 Tax=Paenibacillus larvae TaxID=1464 RepID=V9W322_9BACL|nr:transposase [Paenibacillus larvae subsp. larvae DSM 25430]AQZ47717.1 hypothetical protein B5S25_15175 [Paenibacillus larvae subsp. pulvifaciens]ARF69062.1 hypothetical protein B7C51_16485 [Paenibacillus larvae subsp. pulvifaciens]